MEGKILIMSIQDVLVSYFCCNKSPQTQIYYLKVLEFTSIKWVGSTMFLPEGLGENLFPCCFWLESSPTFPGL